MPTDVKEQQTVRQPEAGEYKPEKIVEETRVHDENLLRNTVEMAKSHDPSFTVEDARPSGQHTLKSPELEVVGAQSVGDEKFEFHEEVESKNRDFRYILKRIADKIRGGGNKIRHAPGNILTKLRRGKIRKASQVENKYDPDQLEIGN